MSESMGPIEAASEGLKEGIKAFAPGLTLTKMAAEIGTELGRLGVQGQAEVASVLFQGTGYVPYGQGQNRSDLVPEPEESLEAMQAEAKEMVKEKEMQKENEPEIKDRERSRGLGS